MESTPLLKLSTSKGMLQDKSTGNVKWIKRVDLGFQQDVEVIAKLLKPNIGHAMGLP